MKLETKIAVAIKNNRIDKTYEELVITLIRQKYSINEELAILRQRDSKPQEFAEYNQFVENIKAQLKAKINEIKLSLGLEIDE
jgi:hypothetical protein